MSNLQQNRFPSAQDGRCVHLDPSSLRGDEKAVKRHEDCGALRYGDRGITIRATTGRKHRVSGGSAKTPWYGRMATKR